MSCKARSFLSRRSSYYSIIGDIQEVDHSDIVPFPSSIYGACMAQLVQTALSNNGRLHCITALVALAVLGNVALQTSVLYFVWLYCSSPAVTKIQHLYREFHKHAFQDGVFVQEMWESWGEKDKSHLCEMVLSQPCFLLVVLMIWSMTMMVEVKETLYFSMWWFCLPRCDSGHVEFIDGAESPEDACEERSKGEEDICSKRHLLILTGASRSLQASVFTLVLWPKLFIGVLLWWLGARWLLATLSFEGLVLNSVALAFVVGLDEMLYQALLPYSTMQDMSLFRIRVPHDKRDRNARLMHNVVQILAKALAITVVPAVYYISCIQELLPDYNWDTHYPCMEIYGLSR